MKEVEKEYANNDLSVSNSAEIYLRLTKPKSEQIFATESLLEEYTIRETKVEEGNKSIEIDASRLSTNSKRELNGDVSR